MEAGARDCLEEIPGPVSGFFGSPSPTESGEPLPDQAVWEQSPAIPIFRRAVASGGVRLRNVAHDVEISEHLPDGFSDKASGSPRSENAMNQGLCRARGPNHSMPSQIRGRGLRREPPSGTHCRTDPNC